MAEDVALQIPISADSNPLKQAMNDVKQNVSGALEGVKNTMNGVRDAFGAAGLLAAGYLKSAIESAAKAEESTDRLRQIVENQGQSWDTASVKVKKFTSGIMEMSDYSGGQARDALTVLEQRGVKLNDALSMQSTLVDLAAGKNIDLSEAANILSDAYNGKTRALVGLGLATKDEIKDGISFAEVQDRINQRFGGSAASDLNTYAGQMKQMQNNLNSIKTTIGSAFLPLFEDLAKYLNGAAQSVSNFVSQNKDLVAGILGAVAVLGTLIGGAGLLQKVMGILGPAITGIGALIGGLTLPIIAVIAAIAALTVAYVKNFGGFKDFIDSTIGAVINAFKTMFSEIQKGTSIGQGFYDGFKKIFGEEFANSVAKVLDAIQFSIKGLIAFLKGDLAGAKDMFYYIFGEDDAANDQKAQAIVNVLSMIKETIKNVIQYLTDVVLPAAINAFQMIGTVLQKVWNSVLYPVLKFILQELGVVVQWVVDNWPLIRKTIETIMNAIQAVIQTVLGFILAFWQAHGETIIAVIKNIWDIIKTVIDTVIHVVLDIIKLVMQIITGDWQGAWNTVVDILKTVFTGAIKIVQDILNIIGNIFKDMAKTAFDWGKNFIQGFIDGISSMVQKVKDAVGGVINGAKKIIGFNSPAEEGEGRHIVEWGANMISGFMDGVKSQIPNMKSLISTAIPNMNTKMSLVGVGAGTGAGSIVNNSFYVQGSVVTERQLLNKLNKNMSKAYQYASGDVIR